MHISSYIVIVFKKKYFFGYVMKLTNFCHVLLLRIMFNTCTYYDYKEWK